MPKITPVLKQAEIFDRLTPTQLEMVAGLCREQSYKALELIFPESAASDELYVIIEGEVEILVNLGLVTNQEHDNLITVATMQRGQSFGEIALVDRGLRSATARAGQPGARLLILPRDQLIELCEAYPQLGYRLMYNLAADLAFKMRTTDLRIREEMLYRPGRKRAS